MGIKVCNIDEEGRFGGPERRIIQVATELKKYGIDTHVVIPVLGSAYFFNKLKSAGIDTQILDITRLSKERNILLRYIVRFFYEIFILFSFFRKNKFDLLHVNGSYQFKVAIAAKLSRTPFVWHLNDTSINFIVHLIFNGLASCCATGFIVAGKRVKNYYLSNHALSSFPIQEIHAPVDTKVFMPKLSNKIESNKLMIGTLSGINRVKGVEYFVKLAAKVKNKYPSVSFHVAGAVLNSQKEYSKYIKSLAIKLSLTDDELLFLGMVEDVPSYLNNLDICVFTSISEASPTSIWEAMSMAKPIVTTDVGSVDQYIVDGVSGFIVPVGDIDQLFYRVSQLIEYPVLCKKMGTEARKVAEKHLSVDSAALKHAEFYRKLVG